MSMHDPRSVPIKITAHVHIHASDVDVLSNIKSMLDKLLSIGENTMTAIGDFAAQQRVFNDRLDSSVRGIQDDIAGLNAKIDELQNTPGAITPEDQALLDEITARGEGIAQKLEALDSMTPPPPPVL